MFSSAYLIVLSASVVLPPQQPSFFRAYSQEPRSEVSDCGFRSFAIFCRKVDDKTKPIVMTTDKKG